MSHIYVIVRPVCMQYTEDIIAVLQSLQYRVLDAKQVKLDDNQTKELLDSLQPSNKDDDALIVEWHNKRTLNLITKLKFINIKHLLCSA